MKRNVLLSLVAAAGVAAAIFFYRHRGPTQLHYTGFVEGEERIIRSEINGRVAEVRFAEGDTVPPDAVIAVIDDNDIKSRIASKRQELGVLDAEIRTHEERIQLVESTWASDLAARKADQRLAESADDVARRTYEREAGLVKSGASTAQLLDDNRARRDQARSSLDRARDLVTRTEAEGRQVALARLELAAARQRRALAVAQLGELEVNQSKYTIHAPSTATVVQTQFLWPAELAQPGAAVLSLLDPNDKYVQLFVPVADSALLTLGKRVAIELDSQPGRRIAGEVSFIADKATFTPEKIETRSDRMGQVYRVKVRILEAVERLQPGTEGNVYLVDAGSVDPGVRSGS